MEIALYEPLIALDSLCPICLSAPSEITIYHCSHNFCKSCLTKYTETKISDGQVLVIRCPFTPCTIILESDFIQTYLPQDSFNKYLTLYKKKSLEADIKFRWCPQKSCEGFDVQKSSNELICNQCGFKFCFLCASAWHGQSKCISSDDSGFIKWFKSNNAKYCPNCRSRTEKNGGCPRMVCGKCGDIWCWRCGLSFSQHEEISCLLGNNSFDITWYAILMLISAPVTFPFWLGFIVLAIIVYHDMIVGANDPMIRMIIKYRWIWVFVSFILSPVLIALGLVLGTIGVSLGVAIEFTPRKWDPTITWYAFAVIYVILIASVFLTLIIALVAIGFCLFPVIGIVLVPLRIYYQLKPR